MGLEAIIFIVIAPVGIGEISCHKKRINLGLTRIMI